MARALSQLVLIALALGLVTTTLAANSGAEAVPLIKGLSFTSTMHAGLSSSAGSLPIADTETVYQVTEVSDDTVSYRFVVSGGQDDAARDIIDRVRRRTFVREVRRSDLQTATRVTVLFSSDDPSLMPGQTFAEGSAAVIRALHDSGEVAYVLGINEPQKGLGMLAGSLAPGDAKSGTPQMISSFMASLGTARHYYRGTLARVGAGSEPFSVLLNAHRTTLPAIHAKGEMTFAGQRLSAEVWWLDDELNPLTLKWSVDNGLGAGATYELVTRIDTSPQGPSTASQIDALAGKSCRAELNGVYFSTGSAVVLEASMPALQRFAALLALHPDWTVTIEGHTDNVGSSDYNMDLSDRRAKAVRDVLVSQFKVPASHLEAKGFGLTRPVETNATEQGRAHNRRVEVSRKCS